MSQLLSRLEKFGCRDLEQTMLRFVGDENFYLEMLREMLSDSGFSDLGKQLAAKNRVAAFEAAHMLKGIAGNCGITPMYETAVAIVEPLRSGVFTDTDENYCRLLLLRDELSELICDLEKK